MKVMNKPIEVVTTFDREGKIKIHRFRIEENESENVTQIHSHGSGIQEKVAGQEIIKFTCRAIVNGLIKMMEIRFNKKTTEWVLYKSQ